MSTSRIPIIGVKGNKKMLLDALWVKFHCSEMDEVANINDLDFMRQIRFNQSSKEICKDYCPRVFLKIRQLLNIKEEDFRNSLLDVNYDSLGDNLGKSGSSLFRTADKRYFIKTIDKSEKDFILQALPSYYHYLYFNRGSFLLKILGVFRVRLDKIRSVHFMVSVNVLPRDKKVSLMYDLKGSTIGRLHKEEETNRATSSGKIPILKDMNMIQSKKVFHFGKKHTKIMKQLYDDSNFLNSLGVIDYSLLVGVVAVTPPLPKRYSQKQKQPSKAPEVIQPSFIQQKEPQRKRPPSLHSVDSQLRDAISTVRQSINEKRLSAMLETTDHLQTQLKNKLADNPFIQADQKRRQASSNKLFNNNYWQRQLEKRQSKPLKRPSAAGAAFYNGTSPPNRAPPPVPLTIETTSAPPTKQRRSQTPTKPKSTLSLPTSTTRSKTPKINPLPVGNYSKVNLGADLKRESLNRHSKRSPSMYVSNDNSELKREYDNGLVGSSEIRKENDQKLNLISYFQTKLSGGQTPDHTPTNVFSTLISSIRTQLGPNTPSSPVLVTTKNTDIAEAMPDGGFSVKSTFTDKRDKSQTASREIFLGIIDITQTYTIRKKAALAVRSIKHDKSQLSSIKPDLYAKRFQSFLETFIQE